MGGGGGFNGLRNIVESAASLAGNYFLPGSSLVTDNLVSKGSQEQLNSPVGKIAQVATGAAGAGVGSGLTGIPQSFGGALEESGVNSILQAVGLSPTDAQVADSNSFAPLDNEQATAAQSTGGTFTSAPTTGSGANGSENILNTSSLDNFNPDLASAPTSGASPATVGSPASPSPPPTPSSGIIGIIKNAIGESPTSPTPAGSTPGSGILGATGGVGGLLKDLLLTGSVGNSILSQQRQTKGLNQLEQSAAGGLNTETGLINTLQSGQLPPGAQATINQQVNDAITSIKSHYANMGMSGSTAEQQDIQAARNAGVTQAFNYAINATQVGLEALGANNSIYENILKTVLGQNTGLSTSLAELAAASSSGSSGKTTTIS